MEKLKDFTYDELVEEINERERKKRMEEEYNRNLSIVDGYLIPQGFTHDELKKINCEVIKEFASIITAHEHCHEMYDKLEKQLSDLKVKVRNLPRRFRKWFY